MATVSPPRVMTFRPRFNRIHHEQAHGQRDRDRGERDERGPQVHQKQHEHDEHDDDRLAEHLRDIVDRPVDEVRLADHITVKHEVQRAAWARPDRTGRRGCR